jgi:acyl dehydratase
VSKDLALSELGGQIGHETYVGEWATVDQARIDAFADATGDHQWIHVDTERAQRESPYGGTIAHGYLTLSLLPTLLGSGGERPAYPGVSRTVNYGLNRVRFPAAVRAGARVRARSTLREVKEVPGGLELVRTITVDVEGSEKPACVAESVSRLYFD